MSVRYQFYRPGAGISKKTTIEDCLDDPQPFGSADQIKAKLSAAFPALAWHQAPDIVGQPWFGESAAVIVQFGYEGNGNVELVMMHDSDVESARKAAKALQAVAIDAIEDKLLLP